MKQDCGHCVKNYTGECKPVDVASCIKNGRPTKFKTGCPELCPDCGGEMIVYRTNKDTKAINYYIPRTRECLSCHKKFSTGEFLLPN